MLEEMKSIKDNFLIKKGYAKVFEKKENSFTLDCKNIRNKKEIFELVSAEFCLDPPESEGVDAMKWDALEDAIGGGIYNLVDQGKKEIVYFVLNIEEIDQDLPEIWNLIEILKLNEDYFDDLNVFSFYVSK